MSTIEWEYDENWVFKISLRPYLVCGMCIPLGKGIVISRNWGEWNGIIIHTHFSPIKWEYDENWVSKITRRLRLICRTSIPLEK
jgi:hypothetical protein